LSRGGNENMDGETTIAFVMDGFSFDYQKILMQR